MMKLLVQRVWLPATIDVSQIERERLELIKLNDVR